MAEKAKRERRKKIYGKDLPTDTSKPIQTETPQKVEESPAVDDECVALESRSNNLILTNPFKGITKELADRTISILNE